MNNQSSAYAQIVKKGQLLYTEITINASPAKVWEVLTDFAAYPEWNPFIKSFKGVPVVGGTVEVELKQADDKGMAFKPTILQYIANKELRWIGRLFIPYVFDGEHAFMLQDNGNGTTTVMQYENFRGILVPFFKKMVDVNTREGFEQMNAALKTRVEDMS